jgi:hypothetical protein
MNNFGRERYARGTAQTPHAVSPKLGDPDIDLALRYVEGSRGFGAGPPIDKDALDDQRSPRRRDCARPSGSRFHAVLTRVAA